MKKYTFNYFYFLAVLNMQYSHATVPFFSVPYTLKTTQIRSEEPKSILIQIL